MKVINLYEHNDIEYYYILVCNFSKIEYEIFFLKIKIILLIQTYNKSIDQRYK